MMRSIVGTIGLLTIISTSVAQETPKLETQKGSGEVPIIILPDTENIPDAARTVQISPEPEFTKQSAIEARHNLCIEQGSSDENCLCRAETSARLMDEQDFTEETRYLVSKNQVALRDFQDRMLAEKRELMLQLGEALSECPAAMIQLE